MNNTHWMILCSCITRVTLQITVEKKKNIGRIILDDFPIHRHWTTASSTSNHTSTAALWSLILGVEAADCARRRLFFLFFFYRKRKQGEVMEFEVRQGRVTEWDVFASRAGVNEFTVRWTWAPQAALTGTCKQVAWSRNRERRRSIRCDVLGPTVCFLTHHNRTAHPPCPEPDSSLLFHRLLNKASCVRRHPAHAD